nr:MAG TPA: Endonuclease [Caudoviricetes sp.]
MDKMRKPSKYKAQKTRRGKLTFDSKKEAERYDALMLLQKAGEIRGLKLQVRYCLQEAYTTFDGLADVRDIGLGEPRMTFMEFNPKVTYRLDESYVQRLMRMRMMGGQDG